jgi:predicted transcriptional regulator
MNKAVIETLVDRIADWPAEAQSEFMQFIAETEAKHLGAYELSDEERRAVERGLAEMRAGKFASDEEVAALFERYR